MIRANLPPVLLSLLLAAPARPDDAEGPDHFVVRGARIVTGTGEVIDGGVLRIDGGLVVDVGPGVPVPGDAWVIEAGGKSVYPGFIDALGTLGLPKPEKPPGNDAPRSRGPEDRPGTHSFRAAADELVLSDGRIRTWRGAGFTSAVTAPEDGIVTGQAAFVNLGAPQSEREREMVVRTPVALRVNLEPLRSSRSYPGSLMGVIAYVKQVFLDAAHYRESWESYESSPLGKKRPTYDRTLGPLSHAMVERWPVLLPASRKHEIVRAIGLAREMGVRPVLYGAHEGYAAAAALAAEGVPVLVSLKWPERDEDADPEAEEPLRVLELRERAPSTPAALEKAGVRFAFYTGGLEKPEEALASVRRALDAGLSRERAVRALTLDAASIFGVSDRVGSLEKGKIANFFIASGDVFEEASRVETVFVDGKKIEIPKKEEAEGGTK
jgi:imidazolonepropionase-like amidohydrolase